MSAANHDAAPRLTPGDRQWPSIAVVVPTYRRPDHLVRCLEALVAQEHQPDEVLAVARPDDLESQRVIARFSHPVRLVLVHEPGLLAAMTAGALASNGDIVAFTDDDAEPDRTWTLRLLTRFEDPAVGGVGGRDVIDGVDPADVTVGRITRWGKLIGNHNRGRGSCRRVDVLKGVNMAYRRQALALPVGYRGQSAQPHTEVAIGLWARARGWHLLYDPSITVVHHEAARTGSVSRERWKHDAAEQAAYNLVAGMLVAQPELFWRRAAYGVLVGDRGTPGLVRAALSLAQRRPWEARAVAPSLRGQLAALRDVRRASGVTIRPLHELQPTDTSQPGRLPSPTSLKESTVTGNRGVCVVIPTKNRPEKLDRCLAALGRARTNISFTVHACDSSTDASTVAAVEQVCAKYPFVELVRHDGTNVGMARNTCTRAASEEIIVSVDDDVRVEPDAIDKLVAAYHRFPPLTVVGGSCAWSGVYSSAIKMRPIGYGRPARPGERPDWLVTALFLYTKTIGTMCPWNERIDTSDDRFIGAVWRSRGVGIEFEATARAIHDEDHNVERFEPHHQHSHIYTNLFDTVIANPHPTRAVAYEVLGFAAGLKAFGRSPATLKPFVSAWVGGHRQLIADRKHLRDLLATGEPSSASSN